MIGILFVGVAVLNRFVTRFWCRGICPLGALTGLLSRFSIFGMEKNHAKCDDCNRCLLHCQGACDPQGKVPWRQAECHLCFNCELACPVDVIRFKFFPRMESINVSPDLKRRRALESVAAGVVLLPVMRASTGYQAVVDIYRMKDPLNAFGIYTQERNPEYPFLKIGNEGYSGAHP